MTFTHLPFDLSINLNANINLLQNERKQITIWHWEFMSINDNKKPFVFS